MYSHSKKYWGFAFWITRAIGNGDIGVDIFFTLSGFLIGYILFKECDKYDGKVDVINFYRGRFIRIWFAEAMYLVVAAFFAPLGYWLPALFFINNLVGG